MDYVKSNQIGMQDIFSLWSQMTRQQKYSQFIQLTNKQKKKDLNVNVIGRVEENIRNRSFVTCIFFTIKSTNCERVCVCVLN